MGGAFRLGIASSEGRTLPRLHLVTDDAVLRRPDLPELLAELLERGGERVAVHLRGPRHEGRRLWEIAAHMLPLARRSGSMVLINDRLDIALAAGADGVQLGERSFPLARARALLGSGRWIGASVHDVPTARARLGEGADFILAGTLYPSGSHPERGGSGLAWLEPLAGVGRILGIGGITPERVREVRAAGAHGVAVIAGVWHAPHPIEALERYLAETEGRSDAGNRDPGQW